MSCKLNGAGVSPTQVDSFRDMGPLIGMNRVIAKRGLERLTDAHRAGLKALFASSPATGSKTSLGGVALNLMAVRVYQQDAHQSAKFTQNLSSLGATLLLMVSCSGVGNFDVKKFP